MVGQNSAIAAGVCGALFIGYCIYFDRKRQSDPNFKNRLRERRKKQKLAKERAGLCKLPDLKDAEAVQKFFLEEIQLVKFYIWNEIGVQLHSFVCGNSLVLAPFFEKTTLSPLIGLGILVENQLAVDVWFCFWIISSISLKNNINQLSLTDINRTLHPTKQDIHSFQVHMEYSPG
uniref:Mitochondrial import receptor subunit TOM20 homolog n=1 Tax=Ailuropoda melanoleuca TaxID=9646 RepID=A0A7N5P6A6_AILME